MNRLRHSRLYEAVPKGAPKTMTDADLTRRIKAGDREAARVLVQEHYASVLRFLLTLCRNPDDAAELSQETFLRALRHIGKFRGDSCLRTWLHRIAFHEFTHRQRQVQPLTLSVEMSSHPFDLASALAVDLERALLALPEPIRAAFVLCEVQELSVAEAANVLRVPQGTIKSRLFTARKQLQAQLQPEHEEKNYATRN